MKMGKKEKKKKRERDGSDWKKTTSWMTSKQGEELVFTFGIVFDVC